MRRRVGLALTLLIGQIKLDAHGVGQANNGANGLLKLRTIPPAPVMTIANASDGATYQPVTLTPANLFAFPNLPPAGTRSSSSGARCRA